jgi:TetR/AcrR family transcriptional regulator, repressor for neighboring sulfatase
VREALLESAQRLMADLGPGNVPLRDIAEDAGVNFGLVYQYLGTREDVLRAVYQRVATRAVTRFEPVEHLSDAVGLFMSIPGDSIARIMAWAALDGSYPGDVFGSSPALEQVAVIIERESAAAGRPMDGDEARLLAALMMVIALGWRLFRSIGLTSAGLDAADDADRERTVTEWLQRFAAMIIHAPED